MLIHKNYLAFILNIIIYVTILVFIPGCADKVTFSSLLQEMTDREQLTYFPGNQYKLKQVSSYNPASVHPDSAGWFMNFDMSHFIRVENRKGRREFVLFDEKGPGAIVRWWMTFYKAQNGTIRIYLDNDSVPVIKGAPREILSGSKIADYPLSASVQEGAPLGEKGRDYDHNFYLPIPFAEHALITYECDSIVQKFEYDGIPVPQGYYWPDVFYNIGYRDYREGTNVETFTIASLKKNRQLIGKAGEILLDEPTPTSENKEFQSKINPGDSLIVDLSRPGSAVTALHIDLDAHDIRQALRSTVISASFDGKRTVWVPVGEFFGTGYIPSNHKTFMNRTSVEGRMDSWWVMPFREKCVISIYNFGDQTVSISGKAGLSPYEWTSKSMYFGAVWHEYRHIRTRDEKGKPYDLNIITIEGKGLYVGDQVTLFNTTHHWWGEGDEKIFVDGERFPSSFGTGTEDYYGYSFGREEAFSHPFVSQPLGQGNMGSGLTVNMRHRSLDAIPFTASIHSDMELWHWADVRMNYALTSYWYVMEPYRLNVSPDKKSVQYPVAESSQDITHSQKNIN